MVCIFFPRQGITIQVSSLDRPCWDECLTAVSDQPRVTNDRSKWRLAERHETFVCSSGSRPLPPERAHAYQFKANQSRRRRQ